MIKTLSPFLALYRRHSGRIALGITLAIITLLASIGLLSLSGWFLAGTAIAGLAAVYFNYMLPAAGVRGSAIIRTAGRYAERLVSHDTTFRILAQLRVFTFSRLLPLTPGAISQFRQAELLNRLVADVDTLDHLYLRLLSPIISGFIAIVIVTFGLAFIDSQLALLLGGILSVLIIITPLLFYFRGKSIGIALTQLRSQYRHQLTAWLQGQAELVIFNALPRFRHKLDDIEQQWLTTQKKQASLAGLSMSFIILMSGLTSVLILWLASDSVGGNSNPGPLTALFVFASLAAFETLAPIGGAFLHLGQVVASAKRVNELLAQKPDVVFTQEESMTPEQVSIQLNNVSFTYPNQPLSTLDNISLSIDANQHIAILGKTGCGKSTLLQLLTRAWDSSQGTILFNGQPIQQYDEYTLRQMMAVVPQRIHIFSDTLRHNLNLANLTQDDDQLIDMLSKVGLSHLLVDEGLDLWLGEGGRQLSGGEQRRIGIARALLHKAPLILMDEPTEGLDYQTEQQIFQLLATNSQGRTLIIVTHRLSNLADMDNIVIMDNGKIIETGSHEQLLKENGYYSRFVQGMQ